MIVRTLEEIADRIDDAVDLMEKTGRNTGTGYSEGDGFCPMGAIGFLYGRDPHKWACWFPPERVAVEQDLPVCDRLSLWGFNDMTRDDQVVFDLMRGTAKRLRAAIDRTDYLGET
jgi:hypothetical protein